ncbi:MAG TPA: hypothetical protein DCZ95_01140 [Verrucomicrobia bacterium]|nr:MAG: hypothetical protein A2X46_00960 [Lentisphaerae bacterium GWF2_57_35]HBA82673.1 hypothetical protein [Verrucomicrobiota bacterium]
MRIPPTTKRVEESTDEVVNRNIRMQMECRLRHYAEHPAQIDARLSELEEEWDIERTLEANASTLALTGVVLGAALSKKFLLLSAAVLGFLCQHAIQGWCPPVPILRRLGFRTQTEIEEERYALRLLRGDFADVLRGGRKTPPEEIIEALSA